MIYLLEDTNHSIIRHESAPRTGEIIVPNGFAVIGQEDEVNPLGLDISIHSWNGVELVIDPIKFQASLPAKQKIKWEEIKRERDRRSFNGIFISGKWIHTDLASRVQWMAMFMMGVNLPRIPWKTMDGTYIDTVPTLATAVFQGVANQDVILFGIANWHKTQMELSLDPINYNYSNGWPATFAI